MTRDEIEFEALRKFRDAGYRLLTAKPREAKEAQEWQAAEMELEKDWTFSMRDAKTREEIEEVTLEFIGRLEERAQEILSR